MGFSSVGIGVFWVVAMGFSSVGIGVFVVAAMAFLCVTVASGLAELSAQAPVDFFREKLGAAQKKREKGLSGDPQMPVTVSAEEGVPPQLHAEPEPGSECASPTTVRDTHIRSWLRRCKLEAYAQALEDDGYDDLQHITGLDEQEIDKVLEEIGMKKGHRRTFKREWAKLQ